jgi:predicted nuclease of predicted toxin-antitoxin system
VKLALDENLPLKVAQALALLDFPVTHVLDHLARGTTDEDLFAEAAKRDWVLVTRDAKMWRKKAQREALRQAGIGVFVLVSSAAHSPSELMAVLLKRIDEMVRLAEQTKRPFVLRVPDRGKIESF